MNTTDTSGPAFPVWELNGQGEPEMTDFGMTLRDYFAAKAMQGLLANKGSCHPADAYEMADAMLKARTE